MYFNKFCWEKKIIYPRENLYSFLGVPEIKKQQQIMNLFI